MRHLTYIQLLPLPRQESYLKRQEATSSDATGIWIDETLDDAINTSFATPTPPVDPAAPTPPAQWPLILSPLVMLRNDTDKGVGDTLARLLDKLGGKTLAQWYTAITGQDCGCTDRQARLNVLYPYTTGGGS